MPQYPRYGRPWGRCAVCGLAFPVHQLRDTRRGGWRCRPGNWVGSSGCDDLDFYQDEHPPKFPPFEGVRRTSAPLVESEDPDDPYSSDEVVIQDRTVPTNKYRVTFGAFIGFAPIVILGSVAKGILVPNDGAVWIQGGFLYWGKPYPLDLTQLVNVPVGSLSIDGSGILNYTPA